MTQPHDSVPLRAPKDQASERLDDEKVAEYLRRHPDFLARHPDVLSELSAPTRWSGDGVVDMQHYLVNRHRTEIDELRDCAQDVIETSRSNMSIQTRSHAAVLALIATRDWEGLVHVLTHDWPLLLDVDVVNMAFEPPQRPDPRLVVPEIRDLISGSVDTILGADQDVRLFRDIKDDGTLFGAGAGLVRSAALIRMRPGPELPAGILALGSRGATFAPGQGTELVSFLCRILEACISRILEEPSA